MNIKSAQYIAKHNREGIACIQAVIDGQEMSVPLDPDNRHYQEILEWAKIDGNTIAEAD